MDLPTINAPTLEVKAFGKDGVRLCWSISATSEGETASETRAIVLSYRDGGEEASWIEMFKVEGNAGIQVVKELGDKSRRPREVWWRCEVGTTVSETKTLVRPQVGSGQRTTKNPTVVPIDEEMAFNVFQWYGTALFDLRDVAEYENCHLRGSWSLQKSGEAGPSQPWKDVALLVGPDPNAQTLQGIGVRLTSGRIFHLKSLTSLVDRFPFLCCNCITTPSAEKGNHSCKVMLEPKGAERYPPPMPNLILPNIFVGHQGHALTIDRWKELMRVTHIVNLAEDRVACPSDEVVYLRAGAEAKLRDAPGEGKAFSKAVDTLVPLIAAEVSKGGHVFIHCQQGRSRSCSLVVAFLMREKGMKLRDAIAFVAERRPELELNRSYAEALIELEVDVDEAPLNLEALILQFPSWFRPAGVARQHGGEESAFST
eukprot:TRINITY_DN12723_c0_g1_i3.p1 TRINITY_DN12723_c0_g1~~TRINITY_DN12723_c0_g1_i3.p1  ORF type:complete len:440 (-),score=53.19 TRINITY_DN12723_c0_g1_i3:234-1514(-)